MESISLGDSSQPIIPQTEQNKTISSNISTKTSKLLPHISHENLSQFFDESIHASIHSVKDLDRSIILVEKEIEHAISSLGSEIELVDAGIDIELIAQSYPDVSLKVLGNTVDLLSAVLPPHILEFHYLGNMLDLTETISTWGSVLLSSLNHGTQIIGYVCKEKMIKQSHFLLNKLRQDFQKKLTTDSLTSAQIENASLLFEEWEKNLKIQSNHLKKEKKEIIVSTSGTVVYISLKLTHSFSTLANVAGFAGIGVHMLSFAMNWAEFIQSLINSSKFSHWQQAYKNWQTRLTDTVNKNSNDTEEIHFNPNFTDEEKAEIVKIKSITGDLYTNEAIKNPSSFQDTLVILDTIIKSTQNLLHKRQAIAKKKHVLINANYSSYESKIKERNQAYFQFEITALEKNLNNALYPLDLLEQQLNELLFVSTSKEALSLKDIFNQYKTAILKNDVTKILSHRQFLIDKLDLKLNVDNYFKAWFEKQPKEALIENYINHQNVIEQTTKNSLKQMIQSKYNLEKNFIALEKFGWGAVSAVSLLSVSSSIALFTAGILAAPLGLGILLLIASIGPAGLGLMFLIGNFIYRLYVKPEATKSLTYPPRLSFNRIAKALNIYRHNAKQKTLWEKTEILRKFNHLTEQQNNPAYIKAKRKYEKAKQEFTKSQEKVEKWTQSLAKLEQEFARKAWIDFANNASLIYARDPQAFDSLRSLNEALTNLDFSLLSSETKILLENHLGINLEELQNLIKEEPKAITEAMHQYGSMAYDQLLNFIDKLRG